MKLTKAQLKRLIKEELEATMNELIANGGYSSMGREAGLCVKLRSAASEHDEGSKELEDIRAKMKELGCEE